MKFPCARMSYVVLAVDCDGIVSVMTQDLRAGIKKWSAHLCDSDECLYDPSVGHGDFA